MTNRLEKILIWILRVGLVLTLFLPLITKWNYFFPFIVPRAVYFQTLTAFLLIPCVALLLFCPHSRPKWSWISKSILLYFVIAAIATVTSVDPGKSFIGTIERSLGYYHLLHFGIVFLAAIMALRNARHWHIFFSIMVAISFIPAGHYLWGILQNSEQIRTSSIMGNPTFLAAYLTFHIFFAGYLITQTQQKIWKVLLAIIIAFEVGVTLATGVRGAFIGLSAATLYLIVHFAWTKKIWRMPLIGFFLILAATYVLIFINRDSDLLRKNYIVQRTTNFSLQDATIRARFAMWRMAWSGFKENPILGWGRENYSIVFNTHFDPSFNQAGVGEGWEDRTHNVFLDELVHGGILGLLTYLAILLSVFLVIRKEPILSALFIAYVTQNLFGVDSLNSLLPYFLFLAFIDTHKNELHEHNVTDRKLSPILTYGIATVSILVISVATFLFTIQPAIGNRTMLRAFLAMTQNNFFEFEKFYAKGKENLELFPSLKIEAVVILNHGFMPLGNQFAQLKTYGLYADKIVNDLDPLSKRNPLEQRWTFALGQLYLQWSIAENNTDRFVKANEVLGSLLASSPNRNIYVKMARNAEKVRYLLIQQQQAQSGTTSGKR